MKVSRPLMLTAALAGLILAACTPVEVLAPPVDNLYITESGISPEQAAYLKKGRKIYLNSCSSCHSLTQVDEITAEDWKTMPKMHRKAKLYDEEIAPLNAYLKQSARINQQLIAKRKK